MSDPSTKILELIENVDVNDANVADILDEIDARVWCLLNDKEPQFLNGFWGFVGYSTYGGNCHTGADKYTRSRDALKSIRPEGWDISIYADHFYGEPPIWNCTIGLHSKEGDVVTKEFTSSSQATGEGMLTEELAELHAIVQAIAYERKAA